MTDQRNKNGEAVKLRRRAEDRILEAGAPSPLLGDELRLLHELQVHQVELELQNEELRLARGELEKALDKYTDLYDFAPVGYFTLDAEGLIREINLTGAKLLGEPRSLLVDRASFIRFVAGVSRTAFADFFLEMFKGESPGILEVTLKVGERLVPVRIEASHADRQNVCRVVVSDLSLARKAEEEARRAEERLRFLLHVSSAMIYSAEPTGVYAPRFTGSDTQRVTGFKPFEFTGSQTFWMDHIHPEDRERVIKSLSPKNMVNPSVLEYRFLKKDGDYIWVRDQHELVLSEDGLAREIVGFMVDITHEKEIEEESERTLLELREALANVKTLRGMLPICASCKKIRDDQGYWRQVESYLHEHTDAEFSHGICPDCAKRLYPEVDLDEEEK